MRRKVSRDQATAEFKTEIYTMLRALGKSDYQANNLMKNNKVQIMGWLGSDNVPITTPQMVARILIRQEKNNLQLHS